MGAKHPVGIDGRVSAGHVDVLLLVSYSVMVLHLWVSTIGKQTFLMVLGTKTLVSCKIIVMK